MEESKLIGSIMGYSIGDAMGAPVDMWTAEFIKSKIPFPINHFIKTHKNDFEGQYTELTKVMLYILENVVKLKYIDPVHISYILHAHKQYINEDFFLVIVAPIAIFLNKSTDETLYDTLSKILTAANDLNNETIDACFLLAKLIIYFSKITEINENTHKEIVAYICSILSSFTFHENLVKTITVVTNSFHYYHNNAEHRNSFIRPCLVETTIASNIIVDYEVNISRTIALAINAIIWNIGSPIRSLSKCIGYGGHTTGSASIVGCLCGVLYGYNWQYNLMTVIENGEYIYDDAKSLYKLLFEINQLTNINNIMSELNL